MGQLTPIEGLSSAVLGDYHLSTEMPIVVRHRVLEQGEPIDPPLYHPYFELGIRLSGSGSFSVEGVSFDRKPYDVFLGGINQPHWGEVKRYPVEFVTIYFLPGVLVQGAAVREEAMSMLDRFSTRQPPERHFVRPTLALRKTITPLFLEMVEEQAQQQPGYLTRVQTNLLTILIEIQRWETERESKAPNSTVPMTSPSVGAKDWLPVIKAMQFIRDHASEKLYARDVAREAGVSQTRLKSAFAQTLRMPWITYQQHCRIHTALLLLKQTDRRVIDIAFEVGFSSMSHFYRTYRAITGQGPPRRGE